MGRATAHVLVAAVLMTRFTEVAVLIPAFRVIKIIKAIRAVTINNLARGVHSGNSLDIKVIQSS